jgi:hypothetical protein
MIAMANMSSSLRSIGLRQKQTAPTKLFEAAPEYIRPMPARRFPPHWSVEEQSACFVVRDHNGRVTQVTDLERNRRQAPV